MPEEAAQGLLRECQSHNTTEMYLHPETTYGNNPGLIHVRKSRNKDDESYNRRDHGTWSC
ncbi:hypothetical protein GMOD_00003353 [Pyrenophora seminiperda CCB06]|uniref:Uncharacterized protein n=1 Tax=Pyrenophora seminiperda CCB06 TaxID=1302712 RepID=A0A3M7MII9_9PLEO|nr:hypothetical protein GMOD_00003353 [Pyrenophora seminiperda CCB06]